MSEEEAQIEDDNFDSVSEGSDLGELDLQDDLDAMIRSQQRAKDREAPPPLRPTITRVPEVVDDYIRNFLIKMKMTQTLETFEAEWYALHASGVMINPGDVLVADAYLQNARQEESISLLSEDVANLQTTLQDATKSFEKMKKERDFHKMAHHRAVQERDRLMRDIKRLQVHATSIEPTVTELRHKYESIMKEKVLLMLEKDKLQAKVTSLEQVVREMDQQPNASKEVTSAQQPQAKAPKKPTKAGAPPTKATTAAQPQGNWPEDNRQNPYLTAAVKVPPATGWTARQTIKAHAMAVSGLSLHPKRPIVATASDDGTWRMFSLPQGELIMSGEGHKDWLSSISIHPKGNMLATASADKTVRLWDFQSTSCKATLTGHTEVVWSCVFHDTGDLLASASLDHSVKIWDTQTYQCRQSLRGHVDSVNAVVWQPYTNTCATAGGDKTVSLWDVRTNYCSQTFFGHQNAVNSVCFPLRADSLASCDADGVVVVWDLRMMAQLHTVNCGPHPANCVSFDKSGSILAVASDDMLIRVHNLQDGKTVQWKGHEDAVQSVAFDLATNSFLVSCGSDATVKYWA